MRKCTVGNCDRPLYAKGECNMHYQRRTKGATLAPEAPSRRGKPNGYAGPVISYHGAHDRLRNDRGPAREYDCTDCGGPAAQWSYNGQDTQDQRVQLVRHGRGNYRQVVYSPWPSFYDPRCVSCHTVFDRSREVTYTA